MNRSYLLKQKVYMDFIVMYYARCYKFVVCEGKFFLR